MINLEEYGPKVLICKSDYNEDDRIYLNSLQKIGDKNRFELIETSEGLYIKPYNFIGSIQLSKHRINIFPRFDHNFRRLIPMILFTKDIKFGHFKKDIQTHSSEQDLFEIIIQLFLEEVKVLFNRNFAKNYIKKNENIKVMKGRIDFTSQITKNYLRSDRIFCNYEELDTDIIENKVILEALNVCLKKTNNDKTKRNIRIIKSMMESYCTPYKKSVFPKIKYNRLNHYYKEAKEGCSLSFYYEMSRLIDLQAAIPLKQIIPAPVFEKEEAFSEHWMEQASIQMERFLKAEKEANRPPEEVKLQAVKFIHEMEDYLSKYYQTELHKLFPGEEAPNYIWVNGFDSGQELLLWLSDIRKRVQSYLMDKESIAEKMELYLEENYAKELSLKEVAEHFHMSTAYFCQYFKKHTGDTLVHYLNYLRIEKAKPMLLKGEESVEEVAEKVGITNSNYFFRVFKQITGKTVGEFRKGGFMESDLNFVNKS